MNSPILHYSKATADLLKNIYSFKLRDNFLLYTNVLDDNVSIILSI